MEFINNAKLRGRIGHAQVSTFDTDRKVITMSVATDYVQADADGNNIIETTWHTVRHFCSAAFDVSALTKGAPVEVEGRLRNQKYTDSRNNERLVTEILATRLVVLQEN